MARRDRYNEKQLEQIAKVQAKKTKRRKARRAKNKRARQQAEAQA